MILNCNCEHTGQDSIHGKGKRVFNKTEKGVGTDFLYRCTVCGREVTKGGTVKLSKGKK